MNIFKYFVFSAVERWSIYDGFIDYVPRLPLSDSATE